MQLEVIKILTQYELGFYSKIYLQATMLNAYFIESFLSLWLKYILLVCQILPEFPGTPIALKKSQNLESMVHFSACTTTLISNINAHCGQPMS